LNLIRGADYDKLSAASRSGGDRCEGIGDMAMQHGAPLEAPDSASIEPNDTLLLLLSAPSPLGRDNGLLGITRLMKLLFLADQEAHFSGTENYQFIPYKYGPFAPDLYDSLRLLREAELLEMHETDLPDSYQMRELSELADPDVQQAARALMTPGRQASSPRQAVFRLTADGRKLADHFRARLPRDRWQQLVDVRQRYELLPLNELLAYVYERYPDWATESILPISRSRGGESTGGASSARS
jgi:uncharacterized protein